MLPGLDPVTRTPAEAGLGLEFDRLLWLRVPWVGPVTPVQLKHGLIRIRTDC